MDQNVTQANTKLQLCSVVRVCKGWRWGWGWQRAPGSLPGRSNKVEIQKLSRNSPDKMRMERLLGWEDNCAKTLVGRSVVNMKAPGRRQAGRRQDGREQGEREPGGTFQARSWRHSGCDKELYPCSCKSWKNLRVLRSVSIEERVELG